MKTITHLQIFSVSPQTYLFIILIGFFTSCKQGDGTTESGNETQEQTTATSGENSDNDASFLAEAGAINMDEIELGKLAQNRATSGEVKAFGKMMIDGHTKSLNELKALADQRGASLTQDVSENGKQTLDELAEVDAKDFDKMFMDKMVDGHNQTILLFENASDNATDPEVKAWALKTVPALRKHLDHAVMVQQKVN